MTSDCLFCRIAGGEIGSAKVFEDDDVFAFRDIAPKAPVHILVIPKAHIRSLDEVGEAHEGLVGRLLTTAAAIARDEGIASTGYRVVTNIARDGGQSVDHLHFHVMGGRSFGWPPG
ncbi:MAG: histidine triad nucleotide-binding protein [Chloroflexota bacterium]